MLIRLVGAVLAEQHDEWAEMRRYIGREVLAKSRLALVPAEPDTDPTEEVTTTAITAQSPDNPLRGDVFIHHVPGLGRDRSH